MKVISKVAWRLSSRGRTTQRAPFLTVIPSRPYLCGIMRTVTRRSTLHRETTLSVPIRHGDWQDPNEEYGTSEYFKNTVKVVQVKERRGEEGWGFWKDETWTPTQRINMMSWPWDTVEFSDEYGSRKCGIEYGHVTIETKSDVQFWDDEYVWVSDGSCKDTQFYYTSMKKTSSQEIEGLFKMIYGPAVQDSNYEDGFLAAANKIGSSHYNDQCFKEMALDYWCRQQYKESASEALEYLFLVAENSESLAKIATGTVVETIKELVADEIIENVKEKLNLPSFDLPDYDFVMDFWMKYFTGAELKRLYAEVELCRK